jgi:hypothetical protein
VPSTAPLSWEVRGSTEKPLLLIWSENCNVTRRVLAITDRSEQRLALAVERSGRSRPDLELKATGNPDLPLQAAEYRARIRRHRAQGDLARYGYFRGLELQSAPPLVYLVAPALRFHPRTDALLRYLSPEIEVVRVGLAESWRRGLRVAMRQ